MEFVFKRFVQFTPILKDIGNLKGFDSILYPLMGKGIKFTTG